MNLEDKVVLITGGSKGIGRSIAEEFVQANARVSICARNREVLEKTKGEIQKDPDKLLIVDADITTERGAKLVMDQTIGAYKGIDILVNNLGGAVRFGNFLELDPSDWEESFRLNLLSMVHMTKLAIPFLKLSNSARIITISSISGVEPGESNPHYTTMKAATINFTKSLANTLSKDKILVNVICPGPTFSDSLEQNMRQTAAKKNKTVAEFSEEFLAQERSKIPLGRLGMGSDIAKMVRYLASEDASWVTGSCFHLNGGKFRSMC